MTNLGVPEHNSGRAQARGPGQGRLAWIAWGAPLRCYFLQGLKLGNVTVCEKVSAVPPVGVNV